MSKNIFLWNLEVLTFCDGKSNIERRQWECRILEIESGYVHFVNGPMHDAENGHDWIKLTLKLLHMSRYFKLESWFLEVNNTVYSSTKKKIQH